MTVAIIMTAMFGFFCIIGGVIGFSKAKSSASLIAGIVFGVVLLSFAWAMGRGAQWAAIGSVLVSILLGIRFFGTWLKKRRLMPDLLMILLSLATISIILYSLSRQ